MAEVLRFVPITIFIAFPCTFIVTYIWSTLNKHVYPLLPHISDTGTLPPESCLFSMMLNLIVALLLFSIYIRHKEIIEILRAKKLDDLIPYSPIVNRIATFAGFIACVGLDLLANFQETGVLAVHGIGALICFWSSSVYILIQTLLTFWVVPEVSSLSMVFVRGTLGVFVTLLTTSSMSTAILASKSFSRGNYNQTQFLNWTSEMRGYNMHLVSSACEWFLVLALALFILTYYWDFKKITIYPPELVVTDEYEEDESEHSHEEIVELMEKPQIFNGEGICPNWGKIDEGHVDEVKKVVQEDKVDEVVPKVKVNEVVPEVKVDEMVLEVKVDEVVPEVKVDQVVPKVKVDEMPCVEK